MTRLSSAIAVLFFLTSQLSIADSLLDVLDDSNKEVALDLSDKSELDFSSLAPKRNAEQTIFFEFLRKGDYNRALFQWPSAFENQSFADSDNGRGLYGLLLFKNGLRVLGLETLFEAEPANLASILKNAWRQTTMGGDSLWKVADLNWQVGWTDIFGPSAQVMVLSRNFVTSLTSKEAESLLRKTNEGTWERSWVEWQTVIALIEDGKDIRGAKVLKHLQTNKNNPVSESLMNLTAARILYQNGYLQEAIQYYGKVDRSTDYWFEAQEEIAWAYLRRGEPQNALATVKSLTPEMFISDVGPEVFYLKALGHMKICDYPDVATTLKTFRTRFQAKAKSLMALKNQPRTPASQKLIGLLEKSRVDMPQLGAFGRDLPRHSTRDEFLYYLSKRFHKLKKEAEISKKLYSQSLSQGTALVGFQAKMEKFKKSVEMRVQRGESAILQRLQTLAGQEVDEIQGVLKKMQIVDAELIQQLAMSERVIKDSAGKKSIQAGSTGAQGRDTLRFPDDGELWFDEISAYKIDVAKGCQATKEL